MIRMDNNIVLNGLDFINSFQDEGPLIFDIVIFSGFEQQKNLFGLEEFNLHEFCNTMGYQHRNLTKEHPNPKWANTNKGVDMPFTNIFENALWRMYTENLIFSKKVEDKSQGMTGVKLKSYKLIDELGKYSYQKKNMYKYEYTLDPILKDHMNTFFSDIDIESIKKLRKPRAVFLYLTLLSLRDQFLDNVIDKVTPYFNFLVEQAQINASKDAKKKYALTTKLEIIKERSSLKFDYEFYNLKGKYDYGVNIYFPKEENLKDKQKKLINSAFNDALINNLIVLFREKYQQRGKLNQDRFNKWIVSPNYDKEEKINCYLATSMLVKRISSEDAKKFCYNEAMRFFQIRKEV